jgi:RNA polymerase sigma-70 factor, ECF subfamily
MAVRTTYAHHVNAPPYSHHPIVVQRMEIAVTGPGDDDELTALVGRVRGGNAAAFDELARRIRDRVRRWARHVVADDDDAEDIAQLVLVQLHQRIGEFEGRSRFATWLYRITRNVALERRRGDARRSALLAREVEAVDDPSAAPDDVTDIARIRQLIAPHFDALPPRQREVFELVELRGLTAGEVAARLGIDASTVRVLLLRARRTVRARLLALHPALLEDYRP